MIGAPSARLLRLALVALVAAFGIVAAASLFSHARAAAAAESRFLAAPTCGDPGLSGCVYHGSARVEETRQVCSRRCHYLIQVKDDSTGRSQLVTGISCRCPISQDDTVSVTWWEGQAVSILDRGFSTQTEFNPGFTASQSRGSVVFAVWITAAVALGLWVLVSRAVPVPLPASTLPFNVAPGLPLGLWAGFAVLSLPVAVLLSSPEDVYVVPLSALALAGIAGAVFLGRFEVSAAGISRRSRLIPWQSLRSVDRYMTRRSTRWNVAGTQAQLGAGGGMTRRSAYRFLRAVAENAPQARITRGAWDAVGRRDTADPTAGSIPGSLPL